MEGSPGTPGRDSRPARATGETAALSTPAQLVQDVQVARSEAVFAMAGVLHRLVSGITGGSSVLTPEQVQHLAIDMGFPITDLDAALEEMSAGEDGEVDVWEFEAWWKRQLQTPGELRALAVADFAATEPNQLAVTRGLRVGVVSSEDDEWWLCAVGGAEGWVPASCLDIETDPGPAAGTGGTDSELDGRDDTGRDLGTSSDGGFLSEGIEATAAAATFRRQAIGVVLGDGLLIWRHPSFVHALAQPLIGHVGLCGESGLTGMLGSMRLLACCLAPVAADTQRRSLVASWTTLVQQSWNEALELTQNLARCTDTGSLHIWLQSWMSRIAALQIGQTALCPLGWRRPETRDEDAEETFLLCVLHKVDREWYSLAVCNGGVNEGAEDYHATLPDHRHGGELLRSRSFVLSEIPAAHIEDSAVWFLLMRPAVFATAGAGPALLYERILPFLNSRPLLRNTIGPAVSIPLGQDPVQWGACVEAIRCTLAFQKSVSGKLAELQLHGRMCQLMQADMQATLDGGGRLSSTDTAIVRMALREVANSAASLAGDDPTVDANELQVMDECLTEVDASIGAVEPDYCPPALMLAADGCVDGKHSLFPLFGRFRRDVSVEQFAGEAEVRAIELPVELSRMPDTVASYEEVATALRTCLELCCLLGNQLGIVRNSYAHRAALVRHLFTRVVPLPLPLNHQQREELCFWGRAESSMRYATQIELVRLLGDIATDYAAISLSMYPTNSFDATRMLVMGCIACIADAILRIQACDAPSIFSQQYAGVAAGPGRPFGIEIGDYARESAYGRFSTPELAIARCQVLDYFDSQRSVIRDDWHTVFKFQNMQCGIGECELIKQVSLASGFSKDEETHVNYVYGDRPELRRRFPELECFRDICFYWTLLMVPSSEELPDQRQWRSSDAVLRWAVTMKEGSRLVSVHAFGRQLSVRPSRATESTGLISRLKSVLGTSKPRVSPSGACPSALTSEQVETEDDVLYIRHLPDFGGRLTAHNVELLLQYLTAPYLRIPLVLSFFCDEMRMKALALTDVQDVLDACLFEPGPWLHNDTIAVPTSIPAPTRDHLSTSCGLLFNELCHSPKFTVDAIEQMVDSLLDLDEGRFSKGSAPYIFCATRILVRLEGYLLTMLENYEWSTYSGPKVSSSGGSSAVRGFQEIHQGDNGVAFIGKAAQNIRSKLFGRVTSLLESWYAGCVREHLIAECCEIWSHLAYTRANLQQMDKESARILLSSQLFLHCNTQDSDIPSDVPPRDRIAKTEIADVFQRHRVDVQKWLASNGHDADEVLEAALDVVAKQQQDQETNEISPARHWVTGSGEFVGRYRPDTELAQEHEAQVLATSSYEEWLRFKTTESVGTEIDTQLGTVTLKREELQLLPPEVMAMADAKLVFGDRELRGSVQAAPVKISEHRQWLRLVGLRHDVMLWHEDTRTLSPDTMGFRRRFPGRLRKSESWIGKIWNECVGPELSDQRLFLSNDDVGGSMARLIGYLANPKEDGAPLQLREVIVLADPPAVQIFNVMQHGRRWYPQLVWSSSATGCMHDMPLGLRASARVGCGEPSLCSGTFAETSTNVGVSLVILRNMIAAVGEQTAIPDRFLHGLLPDALLHTYQFWQSDDETLWGYERTPHTEKPSLLQVTLKRIGGSDRSGFCASLASAVIRRVPVLHSGASLPTLADFDRKRSVHTLLDVQHASSTSDLASLRIFVTRLDALSNILIWSEGNADAGDRLSVDLIEFPRLHLAFRRPARGSVFYSVEHDGLSISNRRSRRVNEILAAAGPTAILMESLSHEFYVLLPAGTKPIAIQSSGVNHILLDQSNSKWYENLGAARAYLYRLHVSESFVFSPGVAASFYMLLHCLLWRQYGRAVATLDSCISDTELTPEEVQIIERLSVVSSDMHPDAIACRLKLSLACNLTPARMPWNSRVDIVHYAHVRMKVSAICRLSMDEELLLLERAADEENVTICNRKSFLYAAREAEGARITTAVCYPPVAAGLEKHFDRNQDYSCTGKQSIASLRASVGSIRYKRPIAQSTDTDTPEEHLRGVKCMDEIGRWIDNGLSITGSLGFYLFYELLTASLSCKILETDSEFTLGRVLLRMLPARDCAKGFLVSVLRVLSAFKSLAERAPKFVEPDTTSWTAKIMSAVDTSSGFLAEIQDYLLQNVNVPKIAEKWNGTDWSNMIVYRGGTEHPRELWSPSSVEFAHDIFHTIDRTAVIPKPTDCTQQRIELRPLKVAGADGTNLNVSRADIAAFASIPLEPIGLDSYVEQRKYKGFICSDLPFASIEFHGAAKSHIARGMLKRLRQDMKWFGHAQSQSHKMCLRGFVDDMNATAVKAAVKSTRQLLGSLQALIQNDMAYAVAAQKHCCDLASGRQISATDANTQRCRLQSRLAQRGGSEVTISFELLVMLLCAKRGEEQIRSLNLSLNEEDARTLFSLVAVIMVTINRIGHATRCAALTRDMLGVLRKMRQDGIGDLQQELSLKASTLAKLLKTSRQCTYERDERGVLSDPRLLMFEFVHGIMLRPQQHALILKFTEAAAQQASLCHQMIMGAGKTTIVSPLLVLLLADKDTLVSQVVPGALLEFSRSVLRQTLAAYGTPVYTFQFSRQTKVTSILRDKLRRARDLRGVVCSTPISVKAFFLKYIELLHILDLSRIQKTARQQKKRPWSLRRAFGLRDKREPRQLSKLELQSIREEVKHTSQIHSIFQRGCCLLDEVDLILHPLKSELNWPLGEKTPLDLTMSATSPGLRWAVPLVLIDAIVFHATDRLCVDQLAETAESWAILQQIKAIVQRGIRSRQLQYNPHLIILDPAFYSKFIMPTLARYLLVWLRLQHLQQGALPKSDALLQYLELGSAAPCAVALADQCGDELLKLISLSHQWLTTLLPHVLTRINRVHYGLLWPDDVQRSLALNPTMPRSRQLVAVPFVGKDVPSAASEFSNPDIVVGLTILAFRYEGVRPIDFVLVIRRLQEALQQETGPHAARPSAIRWAQWVAIAGGYVRGVARRDQEEYAAMGMNDAPSTNVVAQLDLSGQDTQRMKHCWPLHLLDTHDEEQMDLLYRVLGGSPSLQRDLLDNLIFPQVMEAQESKLSASGQEVGGDVLFGVRLGFSGTPSDLLPEEMKPCCFEQGDDASIISVLTDPCNVSYTLTDANWCVTSLLDSIAASSPSYHALIDTGALITGMTNRDVAQYLLQRMPAMEGVVFLDRDDAKQILVRAGGMQQMRLEDSGVALSNRFTYYDQAHTTGMDIKQTLSARAGVTLGKDMTFRDYAQGAYRMRGIGIGQTISLLVTPEIASLISSYVKSVETTAAYERNSIVDVCGWLAMNGMRSEGMQDQLRAEQSLHNVWRKTAYRHLLDHGQLVGTEDADNFTTAALEVFLERLDFTVRSNTGNVSEGMRDRLSLEVDQATAKGLLSDKQAVDDVHAILATVPATSAHRDERMDSQQEQEEEEEEEQEQEQEEEQQQEEEQEQEQQQQTEEYTQQKYVRETMTAEPWEVERLASRPTGKTRRFFPLNSWSGVPGVAPLDCIPSWLYLSRNHSASKPSNVTRFKNIIAVMEWTCPGGASPSFGDTGQDSDERAAHLCRVFELFDADCSKAIEAGELAEILNATGVATSVNEDEPATTALLKGAQQISFQALQNVLIRDELYGIDRDRAFCALSLSEAETLRAILHARGSQPLLSGAPGVTVGLRLLTVSSHNASLLDASAGFNGLDSGVPGVATSQSRIASSCFRFADSATEFDEGAQALLLRSVEGVTPEARTRWWSAVRSCRRRTQGPYGELSVARVLILSHLPTLLETRALRFRINRMIRLRGLSLTDSFRRFNVSSSGHLTCSELYSGVRWLGLELTVQQTHDMMRAADSDRDGRLTLRDWRNTLERRESDDAPWSTAAGNIAEDFSNDTIEQHTIEEISVVLTENAEVTAAAKALSVDTIRAVKVKPRPLKPKNLNLIWDSSSTGSRDSVSIWAMAENANKLLDASKGIFLLSLGHYASSKLAKTPKDVTALRLRGDSINAVTSRFTPHPRRYRLVWQKTVGDAPLYVWQIVPPSTGFVALGMVSTTSDEPPPLEAAVCVPWRWVQASQFEPKLVWTDRGTGGRPGSIWIVNEMGTLAAADGHSKPPPPPPGCAAVLPNGRWPTLKSGFHVDPKDGTGGLTPTRMWKKAGLVRVAVALSRSSAATHTPRRSSGDISSSDSSNDSEEEPGSGSDGDNNDTRTIEVFETAVDDVEVLDYEEEEQFEEYYSSTGSSSDEDGGDGSENSIDGDDLGME